MDLAVSTKRVPVAGMLALTVPVIAFIGWLDYESGPLAMSLFYFVPIVGAAWMSRPIAANVTALAAGGAWITSEILLMQHVTSIIYWNGFTRLSTFVILAVVVSFVRKDRDELAALNARLKDALELESRVARTDVLTGLPNSRFFRETLERELSRSRRENSAIAIAYVDLDNFKRINDTLGHPVGDEVLRRVGEALRSSLRAEDLAARLGGDEFAILNINPTESGLRAVGDRILTDARLIAEDYPNTGFGCTIGFALFTSPPADAIAAIRAADELMYQVKVRSKGQFEVRTIDGSLVTD